MDRINVVGCAYRRWALKILEYIEQQPAINLRIIRSKDEVTVENISQDNPSIVLFYGWSWYVEKGIVDEYTCLGLHPSSLPRYRGGSPIQNQIMNGEVESAVSIFKMNSAMDTGELCAQVPFSLEGNLWDILEQITDIGNYETLRIIRDWQNGSLKFWPQHGESLICARRKPEESEITQDEMNYATARYLYNKVRGLQHPYPNAFIKCADGNKLYITEAHCEE